jgi:hypothetical protein
MKAYFITSRSRLSFKAAEEISSTREFPQSRVEIPELKNVITSG